MAKNKKPSFVVTIRIYSPKYIEDFINNVMNNGNKIYNTAVKHYIKVINKLYKDEEYIKVYNSFKASKDKEESKIYSNQIFELMKKYKLNEYDLHAFMGYQGRTAFNKGIGSAMVQKLGSELYSAIKKAVFRKSKIHYRKKGQTNCLSVKAANNGIIFDKSTHTVKFMGKVISLKPIREKDYYLQEALTNKVKYCKIVRKPFKNDYKYFLQIVLEGTPPEKLNKGNGYCGIDEGTSTLAYFSKNKSDFIVLADGIEKYNKKIKQANDKYFRRLRLANPECFNNDGTFKKGSKFKVRTKGSYKALLELENAYRLKSVFVKQSHNKLVNDLIESCDTFIKEPMDFKALAKKAKETKRQDKSSTIKKKDGSEIQIHKYKKKKRFGKSISDRSPGYFNSQLEKKCKEYNCNIIEVNSKEYKASQYNHRTRKPTKPLLKERTKLIGKRLVQRDLYSAFLLYNIKDENTINFDSCKKEFRNFLRQQQLIVDKIKIQGDKTKNFGLKDFI